MHGIDGLLGNKRVEIGKSRDLGEPRKERRRAGDIGLDDGDQI